MDSYVMKVKNLPEVEAGYMTLGDWIDIISEDIREDMREEVTKEVREEVTEAITKEVREEVTEAVTKEVREKVTEAVKKEITETVTEEVMEKNIKALIEILQEDHTAKENIIAKIQTNFPEYADRTEELVERYWIEH